jgi:hypothetical protein
VVEKHRIRIRNTAGDAFNLFLLGTMALLILFGLVGGLVYLRRNNLEFLFNKNTWSMLAMFFVLSMIR